MTTMPNVSFMFMCLKPLNVNINKRHDNYAQRKFYVYVSTDATTDAASCWTLAAFILTSEKVNRKSECLSNIV